jgi:hypothetical protein
METGLAANVLEGDVSSIVAKFSVVECTTVNMPITRFPNPTPLVGINHKMRKMYTHLMEKSGYVTIILPCGNTQTQSIIYRMIRPPRCIDGQYPYMWQVEITDYHVVAHVDFAKLWKQSVILQEKYTLLTTNDNGVKQCVYNIDIFCSDMPSTLNYLHDGSLSKYDTCNWFAFLFPHFNSLQHCFDEWVLPILPAILNSKMDMLDFATYSKKAGAKRLGVSFVSTPRNK